MSDKDLRLLLYHDFMEDPLLLLYKKSKKLADMTYQFYPALIKKATHRGLFDNLWLFNIADYLLCADNLLSRTLAFTSYNNVKTELLCLAEHELDLLCALCAAPLPATQEGLVEKIVCDFSVIKTNLPYDKHYRGALSFLAELLKEADSKKILDFLGSFHHTWGYGDIVRFGFFDWQDGLLGVSRPDLITLKQLIGYHQQKEIILTNTEAFLNNKPANNILLYGQKGTGKSSLVKAVVNHYADLGLRLLSLSRYSLRELPQILQQLSEYRQKFIIFLDDLSFDVDEKDYKYIKTYIEGGVAVLPENVLLYATSNRRHLVAESWHDRQENGEDIHPGDTVAEKLSLVDRFGITIQFAALDQQEYLEIVEGIAQNENLLLEREDLHREALKWERWQNSRSARTARQFINYLQGRMLNKDIDERKDD
ncbi:MAG: ATP-binding protein [Bacillota bacterium]|jgi:predicted AAA+ superfamily ATPase